MSHRNTRILSGCAALLFCAGLSGCRSVPASRPSASPDPAAHLLGLTAEQRMEDYEYLWSTLRDSYPCWGILEREGVEVERIYTCLLYTSPSPRDVEESRMPSSA